METTIKQKLTVTSNINAPVEKVWEYFFTPKHVIQWNTPSPDWHTPKAENDLRAGGTFNYRMEAKDGSFGFDFGGVYDTVNENELVEYTLGDGRKVSNRFATGNNSTTVTTIFEAEDQNPLEMQQAGWQAILDNFKKYTETN